MPQKITPKIVYKPNTLIGMASKHMEPYRFSQDEAAEVGMLPEDTGVIILIILYIIDRSAMRRESMSLKAGILPVVSG